MKIVAAVLQMPSEPLRVSENLKLADHWLKQAEQGGADLAVLPEMFNTGYGFRPDFAAVAEDSDGPTLRYLRARSRLGKMAIAAGFVEHDDRHLYDSLAFVTPDGATAIYRKRNLVLWECSRFQPRTRAVDRGHALWADRLRDLRGHDASTDLGRLSRSDRSGGGRVGLAGLRGPRHRAEALAAGPDGPAVGVDPAIGRSRPGRSRRLCEPVWSDANQGALPARRDRRQLAARAAFRRPPRAPILALDGRTTSLTAPSPPSGQPTRQRRPQIASDPAASSSRTARS